MIRKAFLLGAGLGTRLRPLTDRLPKPLVPLFHRPLVEWAMDACAAAGIEEFAINTHHLPECWRQLGGDWEYEGGSPWTGENAVAAESARWNGLPVTLFHEPDLLETGGGIRNISAWVGDDDVLVHNGDIYASLPLDRLISAHEASENVVTLALRSEGVAKHIAIEGGQVVDIREMLGRTPGTHVFSGIYVFSPQLLDRIPPGEKISVIPAFLELAKEGRLGGVVLDDGVWFDLGDQESYLAAHRELGLTEPVHPAAEVSETALIEASVVGPGAVVGAGAALRDAVVWPGARIGEGETVEHAVVTP
ncbi:mannose-1-phosphate guanylyltransferase [Haloferula helveola]|uniref:Mannose-1-phosphate guanylyltransferase n=1 Tax=Haloferula helveola TaxID=490095 RepID=A0ABM7RAD6_9BACT|nr:mannose-1-phosphate guanylyltransferase [Haloferula helveola]